MSKYKKYILEIKTGNNWPIKPDCRFHKTLNIWKVKLNENSFHAIVEEETQKYELLLYRFFSQSTPQVCVQRLIQNPVKQGLELFETLVNGFWSLTIFAKCSAFDF